MRFVCVFDVKFDGYRLVASAPTLKLLCPTNTRYLVNPTHSYTQGEVFVQQSCERHCVALDVKFDGGLLVASAHRYELLGGFFTRYLVRQSIVCRWDVAPPAAVARYSV